MDFDLAAQRLARDQSQTRRRNRGRTGGLVSSSNKNGGRGFGSGSGAALSAKAQREVQQRKQQEAERLERKRQQQRQEEYWIQYMRRCDRTLHVQSLLASHNNNNNNNNNDVSSWSSNSTSVPVLPQQQSQPIGPFAPQLQLQAVSIYGQGDKITLPPSVLAFLTNDSHAASSSSSPWTFRIAIRNPDYQTFPSSPLLKAMTPPREDDDESESDSDDDDDDDDDDYDDNNQHKNGGRSKTAAYLDELSYRYLAWTHGTVVEFTQEEGHVGVPSTIAAALIQQGQGRIPVTRTVDPAKTTMNNNKNLNNNHNEKTKNGPNDDDDDVPMQEQNDNPNDDDDDDPTTKTPGHVAWGAFDLPAGPLEISLVQLPKGKACTLIPTPDAIAQGFYQLKDIKLVLEQSLIRTRAVLSVQDVVPTWHRGVQYNVHVTHVAPADYRAVLCINTDIEVNFETPASLPPEPDNDNHDNESSFVSSSQNNIGKDSTWAGGGRTLGTASDQGPPPLASSSSVVAGPNSASSSLSLLPSEPPIGTPELCTIQIRDPSFLKTPIQRRFNVTTATIDQLFQWMQQEIQQQQTQQQQTQQQPQQQMPFQFVTRFPRRVFHANDTRTFQEAGIAPGQELLLVERL